MDQVLRVDNLSVSFRTEGGEVLAVDKVSLSVGRGEIVALVGESGCGKSVTALGIMQLLADTAAVAADAIWLDGRDLLGMSKKALRDVRGYRMSMIFQDPMTSLNPAYTVGGQVAEVIQRHLQLSRRRAQRRAVELLRLVGIPAAEERAKSYPHEFSGGMRQRVMIAMAIACEPSLIIADEPTTALDVTTQAGILELMKELRSRLGTAILLITHDLGVVADIADRAIVMYAGRKIEEAPVQELFSQPLHPYTHGLMEAIPRRQHADRDDVLPSLREIPGTVPVLSESLACCTFADRCPRSGVGCDTAAPELSELAPGHFAACFYPVEQHRDDRVMQR